MLYETNIAVLTRGYHTVERLTRRLAEHAVDPACPLGPDVMVAVTLRDGEVDRTAFTLARTVERGTVLTGPTVESGQEEDGDGINTHVHPQDVADVAWDVDGVLEEAEEGVGATVSVLCAHPEVVLEALADLTEGRSVEEKRAAAVVAELDVTPEERCELVTSYGPDYAVVHVAEPGGVVHGIIDPGVADLRDAATLVGAMVVTA